MDMYKMMSAMVRTMAVCMMGPAIGGSGAIMGQASENGVGENGHKPTVHLGTHKVSCTLKGSWAAEKIANRGSRITPSLGLSRKEERWLMAICHPYLGCECLERGQIPDDIYELATLNGLVDRGFLDAE